MYLRKNLSNLLCEKLKKLNKLRPLAQALTAKLKKRFEIEMTYNSNAIEGNTLTLKETYLVIQYGITVKGKSLKDHLEAKNHQAALEYLYEIIEHDRAITISHHLIKNLHALVIQDINKNIAGQYRKVDVFITGTDHKPPSALNVEIEMNNLVNWAKENINKIPTVDFAAIFHHKFVNIHPFEDGNGRTGRLLMNIFLMRAGFPLVIIQKNDRQKYYHALALADLNKYQTLVNIVGQAVLRTLNIYLDTLTESSKKENFITLAQAAKYCSYSPAYLGKLAKEGRLEAFKEKRNWLTSQKALQAYAESIDKSKNPLQRKLHKL